MLHYTTDKFTTLVILSLVLLHWCRCIDSLTVDNQLVSARNDCFERIALEGMLPFEKTFRTEDTNSLKMCKEKCIQAGEKCQAISFGVHRRGNGTCQLSTEKYATSGGRPGGIIFDPDFDLYARKTNCFDLSDNTIPMSDVVGGVGLLDGVGGGYGGGLSPTPPVYLTNRPVEGTPLLVVNPTPTTITTLDDRQSSPTGGYGSSAGTTQPHFSTLGPVPSTPIGPITSDGDRLYFSHDIYPLYKYPMLYEHNYPAPNQEDIYIPGGYASNVPEVDDRYRPVYAQDESVRPTPNGPPRPIFGLGYGNGYSYGKPELYNPTTSRPYDHPRPYDQSDRDRPRPYNQGDRDRPRPYDQGQGNRDRPRPYDQGNRDHPNYSPRPGPYSPSDRPPSGPTNEHTNRPDFDHTTPSSYYSPSTSYDGPNRLPPSHDQRPPPPPPPSALNAGQRPGDFVDYTNRPDPPQGGFGTSVRPPPPERDPTPGYNELNRFDYVRRNGTAARPDGYIDDKTIATYFNPEDYLPGKKRPPGSYSDRDRVGYPMDQMKDMQLSVAKAVVKDEVETKLN